MDCALLSMINYYVHTYDQMVLCGANAIRVEGDSQLFDIT